MSEISQSQFGYHGCTKETYLKLRQLKKLYWAACSEHGRWRRWARKEPQNRCTIEMVSTNTNRKAYRYTNVPIPEPIRCPVFPAIRDQGSRLNDRYVLQALELSKPVAKKEDVKSIGLSVAAIDQMLGEAQVWWEQVQKQAR